jgi:site-specific DNA-methyltransferase (adenine-specific)
MGGGVEPGQVVPGDCLAVMRTIGDAAIDLVVTSPPYNLGIAYNAYDDRRGDADWLDWMVEVAKAVRRVLRPDGSFFLNVAGSSTQPWLPFELILRLRTVFTLQNHIVWVKSIALPDDSVGHFKPVPGERFLHRNHEHVFHLTLSGDVRLDRLAVGVPFKDKSNIARRGHAADRRCRGDTWFIPYKTVQSRAGKFSHPGTFPVDLPRWCIRLHGKRDGTVLDPFAGTGTTLVAARLEGWTGYGIEIDPDYVATANARLSEPLVAA